MSSSVTVAEPLARALLDAAASSAANPAEIERLAVQLDALTPAQRREVARVRDMSGRTILHHACLQGNGALVRRLLADAAADLRAQDGQLQTALHLALKAANDDQRQQTEQSSSAVAAAPRANPHAECAALILDADEQQQQNSTAPASSEGAEPETKRAKLASDELTSSQTQQPSLLALADSFGRLPLHWAVAVPSLLIRCLRPELLNAQTASGETVTHWAAQDGNLDALDTLLSAGARLDLANARGETPADVAKTDATRGVIQAWRERRDALIAAAGASESKDSDAGTVSIASLASKSAAGGARMTTAAPKKKLAIKMKK